MADGTITDISRDQSAQKAVWTLTTADHTGSGFPAIEWSDQKSFQFTGTWGGATAIVEGSNDGGTTWAGLRDQAGTAISFTANGLKMVAETVEQIRPRLSVVGTGATVVATLVIKKTTSART